MSHFTSGQLNQLGDALEAAEWTAEDVTNLGQAGKTRLTQIRVSLQEEIAVEKVQEVKV